MKIVTFQYNREASASYQLSKHNVPVTGSMTLKLFIDSITNKLDDRTLWDEAFRRPQKTAQEFIIQSSWQ
ncbi:MAG: hypothetical protein AB7U29_18765 [Desulfobulbus sp.]